MAESKYRGRAYLGGGWACIAGITLGTFLSCSDAQFKYALLSAVVHRWIMLGSEKNRSWFESYHRLVGRSPTFAYWLPPAIREGRATPN